MQNPGRFSLNRPVRTARSGRPGQDGPVRTARSGRPGQDGSVEQDGANRGERVQRVNVAGQGLHPGGVRAGRNAGGDQQVGRLPALGGCSRAQLDQVVVERMYVTDIQSLLAALVRLVQVMPSGEVITR